MKNRVYRNARLELRRQENLARSLADARLASGKRRKCSLALEVERGLSGQTEPTDQNHLSGLIARECFLMSRVRNSASALFRTEMFASLLRGLASTRSSVLEKPESIGVLGTIVRDQFDGTASDAFPNGFVRPPDSFEPPRSRDYHRQLALFLRHLFCRYPLSPVFDEGWYEPRKGRRMRRWWYHLASGANLRTAPDLPMEVTRKMAHIVTTSSVTGIKAFRYAQFVAGGLSPLTAEALANTRLGDTLDHQEFTGRFIRFLSANPGFPREQLVAVVDYALATRVRGDEIRLSFTGRTERSVLRLIRDWHWSLRRVHTYSSVGSWEPCNVREYHRVEGQGSSRREIVVRELLSGEELAVEGTAMRHCVATYALRCARRQVAIFSAREMTPRGIEPLATIEVEPVSRSIHQARGRCNTMPSPVADRVIRAWAQQAGIKVVRY